MKKLNSIQIKEIEFNSRFEMEKMNWNKINR
jgi:hypothetical protein